MQTVIASLMVLAAALWVIRRGWQTFVSHTGPSGPTGSSCGACGHCSGGQPVESDAPVVTLASKRP